MVLLQWQRDTSGVKEVVRPHTRKIDSRMEGMNHSALRWSKSDAARAVLCVLCVLRGAADASHMMRDCMFW